MLGTWGWAVALAVWAYREGGPPLVGVTLLVRFVPAAVTALFVGAIVDRFTRRGVMIFADLGRCVLLVVAAVLIALDLPPAVVLVPIAGVSVLAGLFQPAKLALVPALTPTAEHLTAANVVSGLIENVGMFLGPALGGVLLTLTSPEVVFAWTAACVLWSAALVSRIQLEETPSRDALTIKEALGDATSVVAEIRRPGPVRVLLGLATGQTIVAGALNALVVVVALDLLSRGAGWVGYLDGSVGVGGVIGAAASVMLVGRPRLSGAFALAMVMWGVPLVVIALLSSPAVALAMLAVLGIGNSVGDVALLTMLQRAVPEERLTRVFGGLEVLMVGSIAIGGFAASIVVELAGAEAALVGFGAMLPILTLVLWRPLRAVDASSEPAAEALRVLRPIPMFGVLPGPVLEGLALNASRVSVPAGQAVFHQGDPGDRYYAIESGRVEIFVDERPVRVQGAGDGFGEIALLRELPRTATVRALEPLSLWALDRDTFLSAVAGHPTSVEEGDRIVTTRLRHSRPSFASV